MNWDQHYQSLTDKGYATIPAFFTPQECIAFREMYDKVKLYRSVISMQRYRFGQGEYKYFAYPLPEMLERFRKSLGDALIFTTSFRPAKGKRGFYKVTMKHGISEVTRGERYALGIILHDAR
jgi:hypothetical protein